MRHVQRWGWTAALCACLCVILASCDRSPEGVPEANRVLSVIEFPSLPAGVTTVRTWHGGVFAKFVNIKFTASQEQALAYLKANETPHYFEFSVTNGVPRVTATHDLGTPEPTAIEVPNRDRVLTGADMLTQPWFRSVGEIQHGWFFSCEEGIVGYRFYYDLDTEQFYIYWYYS